ncbi:DUF461 domain-containing protein [Streptomyces sp. B-S-A8]|uniref:DUF461 domain-containing protein n=1 Tax=Streptomyces solicavernae TaxID=3043614 RepID=A0ABT6RUZ5_9ACTN|nr:DUF461 domain-containing protein [Streptomyces sp. B-S-A8]MDI3388264.1 DUF461 domain-containing protein [Streptomyces sp. B-S-A8]
MSRSLRRGTIAATALGFSIATLAGCAAGTNAQTLGVKPDHAATSVGDIKIQNALVITQPDVKSTGPAVVAATVFNEGTEAQTLESIKVAGLDAAAQLKPAKGGKLTIPAGGSLVIGGAGNASASLPSGSEAVQDGDAHPVTFSFSETGDVKINPFVVPATSYFKKWGPSEVPAAPDAKPTGGATPSQGASGKPTEGVASGEPNPNGTASEGAADHEAAGH